MTQLASETWKCYDAVQRELHEGKLITSLPDTWKLTNLPEWKDIEKVLLHYYPVVFNDINNDNNIIMMVHHAKLLFACSNSAHGHNNKELVARILFRLFAVNQWFIQKYPKFALTIKNKLLECKAFHLYETKDVYTDFKWILDGTDSEISEISEIPKHSYNLRSSAKKDCSGGHKNPRCKI